MARYLSIRIVLGLITIVGVIVLTFALQFLVPGDPARRIAGPRATPEVLAVVRANEHLNDSVGVQFLHYAENVARGDLGVSYKRLGDLAAIQTASGEKEYEILAVS